MTTKHPIEQEFPEYAEKIHTLKVENIHFKKMFEQYDAIDHEIYKIESNAEPTSDEILNKMRLDRVHLKDEMYNFLKNN